MRLEVTFLFSQLLLAPSGIFDDENLSLFFTYAIAKMCSLCSVGGPLIIWAYAQDVLFIFVSIFVFILSVRDSSLFIDAVWLFSFG